MVTCFVLLRGLIDVPDELLETISMGAQRIVTVLGPNQAWQAGEDYDKYCDGDA
ncbi:hypothetical protein LBMAG42_54120 [Deltaproteobacteria bacterium]|nr:hypothetical protein LBMAG42_54120 [Deltaproteobacteria bacterium]